MDHQGGTAPLLPGVEDRPPGQLPGEAAPAAPAAGETIFTLIADRARSHSTFHLALTAIVGIIDALAIGWARPTFWPVAALFAAMGAYGAWGYVDRAIVRMEQGQPSRGARFALSGLYGARVGTAVLGVIAAIVA